MHWGVTFVHVNLIHRELREAGLVSLRQWRGDIMDLEGLVTLAHFDPACLDQAGPLFV